MNPLEQEDGAPLEIVEDELTVLKERATILGVKFHPNIKLESLKEKVSAALSKDAPKAAAASEDSAEEGDTAPVESIGQKRRRIKLEALKLVRIRVTCLNPAKKEWEGELFTVGNSLLGSVTKYIPFDAAEDGYHVPQIILNQLRQRMCQTFYTAKDERGNKVRKGKLIKEFGIEVLPQLTAEELKELAQRQALARSID